MTPRKIKINTKNIKKYYFKIQNRSPQYVYAIQFYEKYKRTEMGDGHTYFYRFDLI